MKIFVPVLAEGPLVHFPYELSISHVLSSWYGGYMEQKYFVSAVLLGGIFYVVGQYVVSGPVRDAGNALTVQATGAAHATPNLAHVVLGVQVSSQQTAAAVTDMLAAQGNLVIAAVKKLGIAEVDIQTQNISVQPTYNYDNGKQILKGYEGSQQLDITVRKTDQAGNAIAKAAEAGANQIGGITFKNDDPEVTQLAAEKDAIANARNKADALAKSLGVRLGKVKNYTAQQNNYGGPVPYALEGKAMGTDTVTPPELSAGTQETTVNVTVTYEIR